MQIHTRFAVALSLLAGLGSAAPAVITKKEAANLPANCAYVSDGTAARKIICTAAAGVHPEVEASLGKSCVKTAYGSKCVLSGVPTEFISGLARRATDIEAQDAYILIIILPQE